MAKKDTKVKRVEVKKGNGVIKTKLIGKGGVVKIITKKSLSGRYFFMSDKIVAYYVLNLMVKEPTVLIYKGIKNIKKKPVLTLKRSEICDDRYRLKQKLLPYFIEELATEIEYYLLKDLNCPEFSPMSYIKVRQGEELLKDSK